MDTARPLRTSITKEYKKDDIQEEQQEETAEFELEK
jgi:hypothetical protein|tara:strand:+ start:560 stop:667 length:108 start_codon:yes stop_codon:yes gene_type:complete